jgi:hypothetical protein
LPAALLVDIMAASKQISQPAGSQLITWLLALSSRVSATNSQRGVLLLRVWLDPLRTSCVIALQQVVGV